ncbi:MAG: hypothetical protein PCFJNLEI_02500 [Verrucomicrobiae bacterium]|nr:hypothetical protein [Verrucomicrobiae bacterium]
MKNFILLASLLWSLPVFADAPTAVEVVAKLDKLKATLADEVTSALATNRYATSYTTVWRNFEDDAQAALCTALQKHIPGLTQKNFDTGQAGSEKNRLADLAIVCGGQTIEVSIKAARGSQNPENDMGTFRDHANRKKLFVAAFTLFGRYVDSNSVIRVDRVFFDRTYRIVGKSTLVDGVKYRKKDGNMRPKPWAMFDTGKAFWESVEEFEAGVKRAESFRARELVKEHLAGMSEAEQQVLYEHLKKKFGD